MKRNFVQSIAHHGRLPSKQKGAYTMFTAILILILLTEMIIYAVQTGVFEQRKSANEMRQKVAFHLADSAIQFGKEYMQANALYVVSADDDILPTGGEDGWLSPSGLRWQKCSDAGLSAAQGEHPCYAEPADNSTDFPADLRNNMYYYSFGTVDAGGNAKDLTDLPIDLDSIIADTTQDVSLHALLCMLDVDRDLDPIIQGCTMTPPADPDNPQPGEQDDRYYMVTLLSRGEADCDNGICTATALIADKIGSFGPGGGEGGPGVPLTSKTTFPPTGTAEVVPNPNGGGVGVPISAWVNARTIGNLCELSDIPFDPTGGSWATCEPHEWYGVDILPDDYRCPTANCSCASSERRLSWSDGNSDHMGIDLVPDENFPCDLFLYMFGVNKDAEGIDFVKYGLAQEVLTDCSSLDENSHGVYWVSGSLCNVSADTQIGSPKAPVFLISATEITRFNGNATLFGVLFVTDAEVPDMVPKAEFHAVGTMTIYGAAVIDAEIGAYNGTFQVVYVENILNTVVQKGDSGSVAGSWSDFHQDWR